MDHSDFKIAWICALPIEMAAAEAMLDDVYPTLQSKPGDDNAYRYGCIGGHNIVIACLPSGSTGLASIAGVAAGIRRSFGEFKLGLMVGIGGGVPGQVEKHNLRLGDVVVSRPTSSFGGVVQYYSGRAIQHNQIQRTGSLNRPPNALLAAVAALEAKHVRQGSDVSRHLAQMIRGNPRMHPAFSYQGTENDKLFNASYDHVGPAGDCVYCDEGWLTSRPPRPDSQPMIHYGTVASGNTVMKHGETRDRIAKDLNVLCFEMEAAGLMNSFPCLVVRGILDYADSHKSKLWQPYAAATAAAFAKELLCTIPADVPLPPLTHSISGLSIQSSDMRSTSVQKPKKRNAYFKIPYPSSKSFIGRESYLERIMQTLSVGENSGIALFGLRGSGKTQTAIKFAEIHRHNYHGVFFINAASDEDIANEFDKLHDLLDLGTSKEAERTGKVIKWFSDDSNSPWLLVFDNADSLENIKLSSFLPYGSGHIIITTLDHRVQDLDLVSEVLQLEMMSADESRELLLKRTGRRSLSDAEQAIVNEIAKHLGYLPLALDSAAAQIHHQRLSFKHYLTAFQERTEDSKHLLRYRPSMSNYDKAIFDVLDINYDQLKEESSSTFDLLTLFAHLDGTSVQFSLLEGGVEPQWRVGKDGEFCLQTPEQSCVSPRILKLLRDKIKFGEAIERLMSLSLVYHGGLSSDEPTLEVSMHPLVQLHVQSRLTPLERETGILAASSLVAHVFPLAFRLEDFSRVPSFVIPDFDEYKRLKYTYLPHARVCCQNLESLLQQRQQTGQNVSLSRELMNIKSNSTSLLDQIVCLLSEASMIKIGHNKQDMNTTDWCKRFLDLIDALIADEADEYIRVLRIQNIASFNYSKGSYQRSSAAAMDFLKQYYPQLIDESTVAPPIVDAPISDIPLLNTDLCQIVIRLADNIVTEKNSTGPFERSHTLLALCRAVDPESPSMAETHVLHLRDRITGKVFKDQGRYQEGAEALEAYCRICLPGSMDEGWATADWAHCLMELDRADDAEAAIQNLVYKRQTDHKFWSERPFADKESDHNLLQINLAECHLRQGRLELAEDEFQGILDYMLKVDNIPHEDKTRIFSIYTGLARISHNRADWATAKKRWQDCVDYGASVSPGDKPWGHGHFYVGVATLSLADVLFELGNHSIAFRMKHDLDNGWVLSEPNHMHWMLGIGTYWLSRMLEKWRERVETS